MPYFLSALNAVDFLADKTKTWDSISAKLFSNYAQSLKERSPIFLKT